MSKACPHEVGQLHPESVRNVVLFSRTYPCTVGSVTSARRDGLVVLLALGVVTSPGMLDDVALIVSELASNAVEHASTAFTLRLETSPSSIIVTVRDGDLHMAEAHPLNAGSHRGRGLALISQLSSAWGVTPYDDGKAVWARIPMHMSGFEPEDAQPPAGS